MGRKSNAAGVYNSGGITLSNGDDADFQFNASGHLLVSAGTTASPQPVADVPTAIGDNRKTVATAGTAEALAASTACRSVIITAETDNTGIIVVGGSTVVASLSTRRGTPLSAGESVAIDIDNLSKVYLDTTVNGDGVTYTYLA
jgi:hypothetical protein